MLCDYVCFIILYYININMLSDVSTVYVTILYLYMICLILISSLIFGAFFPYIVLFRLQSVDV